MKYFEHPQIDRYLIQFGEFGITYYSLAYVLGILLGWYYGIYLIKKTKLSIKVEYFDNFITWLIVAIVAGGRIGYVLFYDPVRYFSNPIEILQTYKGGMSFHGGLAGVIIGSYIFCRVYKISFFSITDILAQCTPIGLMLGRIANFINAELYGYPTEMPWGVIFPNAGYVPRHPSQLYEALLEGLVLFVVMRYLSLNLKIYKASGLLSGYFLLFYGIFRSFVEFFRIPDYYYLGLTSGQLLSLPMIIIGLILILTVDARKKNS